MGLAYGSLFEKWEIRLTNAIIREFKASYKILEKEDEDDLAQECLTQWFYAKNKYTPQEGASMKSYMRRVIKNKLLKIVRSLQTEKRKASYETIPLDEEIGISEEDLQSKNKDDPAKSIRESDLEFLIQKVFAKLSPKQQELCRLVYEEGLSINEASKHFKESRASIYREVLHIREIFKKEGLKDFL